MKAQAQKETNLHPIQVVARRTGLTPDLIRVWERRYGAVEPTRSPSNRRLYTDDDVDRLRLLRLCTLGGRRIGDIAGLTTDELRRLTAEDEAAAGAAPAPTPRAEPPTAEPFLALCIEAVEGMDADKLESTLASAAVSLSMPMLLERLLMPLMEMIGSRWSDGTLRIAHEHMATAVVRSFLGALKESRPVSDSAPTVVVTTPAGQLHELGALTAAVAAASDGWKVNYLGPNLPAEEIAAAARSSAARCVALSIVHPADDPRLPQEIRALRRLMGEGVSLVVGGSAAPSYDDVLQETGATLTNDIPSLRAQLESLRYRD